MLELQALHITNCKRLVKLPDSIGKLRRLRSLEVSHARDLKHLPDSIGDCCNLQSLHLICYSNLKEIPTSVGNIKKLRVLNTYGCFSLQQLASESFGMLQNLQHINLNDCQDLRYLPTSFASYRLHVLRLSGMKLTILPQCITLLTSLEYIELQNCMDLVELPEGIGNLKRLQVLNLEGCRSLRGLPRGFEHLTRIITLGLFVIGDGRENAGISELRNLNIISGDLKIVGIRNLKNANDAHKAYLKKKWHMQVDDRLVASEEGLEDQQ